MRAVDDELTPSRLHMADVARVGATGLRAHPLRAALSAVGIAVGIAAMLAVLGISASSRAELDRTLSRLGTNLLTVSAGSSSGGDTGLPAESVSMIRRIGPVTTAAGVGRVSAWVYRNDLVPAERTNSIAVLAVRSDVLGAVAGHVATGRWVDDRLGALPTVVLGHATAQRLGVTAPGTRVWLGGRWFAVVGILDPVALAPEVDGSALVPWAAAQRLLGFDGRPTLVYVRSAEPAVEAVRSVLARTADPAAPNEVAVSRPSDALVAKRATTSALDTLLLALAGVALLVGGIGVANTMVIAVLERRWEIGLRRALGATRGQIRMQFLTESVLLSVLGGASGVLLGLAVTGAYASARSWPAVLPLWAMAGARGVTTAVGALSGLYPAVRAARLSPTDALAAT